MVSKSFEILNILIRSEILSETEDKKQREEVTCESQSLFYRGTQAQVQ